MTADKVHKARQQYKESDVTQRELAIVYDISQGAMGSLLRGETWGHVEWD